MVRQCRGPCRIRRRKRSYSCDTNGRLSRGNDPAGGSQALSQRRPPDGAAHSFGGQGSQPVRLRGLGSFSSTGEPTSSGMRRAWSRSSASGPGRFRTPSSVRNPRLLASTLFDASNEALLFRTLATLGTDVPVFDTVEELRWRGERPEFESTYGRVMPGYSLRVSIAGSEPEVNLGCGLPRPRPCA